MKKSYVIPIYYYVFSIPILLFCFLGFSYEWDIKHTVTSSYAILNGHLLDFYDYNKTIPSIGGNDYEIFVYLIFAIWNIPTKLLGFARPEIFPVFVLLYNKLLICILYFGCSYFIYKIGVMLFRDNIAAKFAAASFILCPIAAFGPFIFTQYDSFYTIMMLAGLLVYLQGENKRNQWIGTVLVGISILFKPFALIGFIPLILYNNKNILKILFLLLLSVIPTTITKFIFTGAGGGVGFISRLFESVINVSSWGIFKISLFSMFYFLLCAICYFSEFPENESKNSITSIYIIYVSYAVFFSFILWHPMWLLIMMPFCILTTIASPKRESLLLVEIAMTAGFIGTVFVSWGTSIAENLLAHNLLRYLNLQYTAGRTVSSVLLSTSFPFYSLYVSALVVDIYLKFPITKSHITLSHPISFSDWKYRMLAFCIGILGCTMPPIIGCLI